MIPRTHNHARYPGGIAGTELLALMRAQAADFGAVVTGSVIEGLERAEEGFVARAQGREWYARTVLLCTGVVNNRPPIAPDMHDAALRRGLLRYCPICDGYEVADKRVGILGTRSHGFKEAIFLRMYTPDVTLIATDGEHDLSDDEKRQLAAAGVLLIDGPCAPLRLEDAQIVVPTPRGELKFDSVYSALGSVIRSELATAIGAEGTDDGCLIVDDHQRTSILGLYAAGDVAKGLDQISHAMGEAGVAATTIRNDLAERGLLLR